MVENNKINISWLQALAHGPMTKVTCWPIYFCRGYIFHTYDHGKDKTNANYGVCVKDTSSHGSSGDPDFYGVLQGIYELHYPGQVHLKVVLFKCDWYDSTIGKGIRVNKSGIIDVHTGKRYGKYDPFILASQADQVCYVPYPRVTQKKDQHWKAAIVIQPRGKILMNQNFDSTTMQHSDDNSVVSTDILQVETLVNLHGQTENLEDVEEEAGLRSDAEDENIDYELTDEESD
ncbi:hypothetical protein Bca52824_026681 [Brassica carinata]|uniref:DUF4216 domain-containing protein n=1 Tax=Brassica carinata TaxID=52824 RepID=A0A8X7SIB5_BRACI|nr:hypothetical protein Bca52824_026681 [Brassica carinata]